MLLRLRVEVSDVDERTDDAGIDALTDVLRDARSAAYTELRERWGDQDAGPVSARHEAQKIDRRALLDALDAVPRDESFWTQISDEARDELDAERDRAERAETDNWWLREAVSVLYRALDRAEANLSSVVRGSPVRDLAETYAEAESARRIARTALGVPDG